MRPAVIGDFFSFIDLFDRLDSVSLEVRKCSGFGGRFDLDDKIGKTFRVY